MRDAASKLSVRRWRSEDRESVLALARRLASFGPPPWRTPEEVVNSEVRALLAYFEQPAPTSELLVAEDGRGERVGFAFLETLKDYFSGEFHGHIGMLAVAAACEGGGVGRALMDAAERWAAERGFRRLTLNVFDGNRRARAVYEHLGYRPETLRYVKLLESAK